MLRTDVSVYDVRDLVVMLRVCPTYLHLAPCCYVLYHLWGIFAQSSPWVLSGEVDPGLYQSCVQGLFWCCHDQCLCAVPAVGFWLCLASS